jgi:hypothetical protein
MAAEDYIDFDGWDGYTLGETDYGPEYDTHRYTIWVSRDGVETPVYEMSDSHITAILHMFDSWSYLNAYWDGWRDVLETELEHRHDMD